ncbi:MAG: NAD(P)H-binding protein, partial [Gemmatimonadales bacterium]|nr:NAD(P)H-binding protein [Gemmatimonadales bacterium]
MTGATGFVGSRVVERLLRRDHEVRILTRNPERAGWLRDRGVEVVAGGVESQSPLRALVAGAGAVVHLVGIIVEVAGQTFERVHVSGTRNVLGAAREAGVPRLVHMSALGARPDREATAYHRTKAAAEELVRTSGVSHAILRPSLIAGQGSPPLRMMVDMLRLSPVVPVIGDGKYQMQPVAIEDVAEVFALAVEKPDIRGTFDVAGLDALTYHEMLDLFERALGVKRRRVPVPVGMVRFAAYAGMALP